MTSAPHGPVAVEDRVAVRSFGTHSGVVTEIAPRVTIQGRACQPAGWVRVRLDDGRDFCGHTDHLARDGGLAAA